MPSLINSDARAEMIRSVDASLDALEAKRRSISEEISAIKAEFVKGQLGMKISDFNAARRIARLEREKRDPAVMAIRECFSALGIGEQVDWVAALEAEHAAPPQPTETEKSPFDDPFSPPQSPPTAAVVSRDDDGDGDDDDGAAASMTAGSDYNAGVEAFNIGVPREAVPYKRGGRRKLWLQGWDAERAKHGIGIGE